MTTSTRIRSATSQDAAAIAALFADESIAMWTDELPYHSAQEWQAKIESAQKAGAFTWVYERNSEVLGYVKLTSITFPRRKHVAQLGPILVAKSAQRQGVGALLLQHAINACDSWLQVRRIELVIDADNDAARALFISQGFVVETSPKAYRAIE
jgi:L-phenylalanine/L-methionine N-acetyltransferase